MKITTDMTVGWFIDVRYLTAEERLVLHSILDERREAARGGLDWFDSNEGLKDPDRTQQVDELRVTISAINKLIGGD